MQLFEGKRILVTGGTGSLGHALVRRLLTDEMGRPDKITVFSRDEAKQQCMRQEFPSQMLAFHIGDVRSYPAVLSAVRQADIIFHAAALKQVPACEYFPYEAVLTNITGAWNIVRAIQKNTTSVKLVIGASTDKACKPVNVMGMTKALQERIFIEANRGCPHTRFLCVRYGNIIASRGSVIPLFLNQIRQGGPVTVTVREMTRFLLSLGQAMDTIFAAARGGLAGEIYVPQASSARIVDVAEVLIDGRDIPIVYIGIRPGEKVHEILVSEEECYRTIERDGYYVICSALPELRQASTYGTSKRLVLAGEYCSANTILSRDDLRVLLAEGLT